MLRQRGKNTDVNGWCGKSSPLLFPSHTHSFHVVFCQMLRADDSLQNTNHPGYAKTLNMTFFNLQEMKLRFPMLSIYVLGVK